MPCNLPSFVDVLDSNAAGPGFIFFKHFILVVDDIIGYFN